MTRMDDGENNNSAKQIEFKPINVDYNISLAEAIKLSVEKTGYEAEIIKKENVTIVDIKIPFLFAHEEDRVRLSIFDEIYTVTTCISVRKPNTLEEKLALLEYVNDKNGFVSFSWVNTDKRCYIAVAKQCWRMDEVDEELEWRLINIDIGNAEIDGNEELAEEKSALRERISVYMDENIDFNMSDKWNATHGYEYLYILDDINNLIGVVQKERENLLRFI